MNQSYQLLPVMAFMFLLLGGCEVINPDEEIPSYIHIDEIIVESDFPTTGTIDHKITDAWIFVNDNIIGPFELPVTIPVLADGPQKITVFGGILRNGIKASRAIYPFFEAYERTFELVRDSTITLNPVIKHRSPDDVDYFWVEDFEDIAISIDTLPGSTVPILRTEKGPDTFEGNASGSGHLDVDNPIFHIASVNFFALPKAGPRVYLEMNYKTSTNLEVGAVIDSRDFGLNDQVFITLRPTIDEDGELFWNKVYIDLSDFVNLDPSAQGFQIALGANVQISGETADVFIDNLKLIAQPQ